jgi:F0F1-type ATP synthase assembly protein I
MKFIFCLSVCHTTFSGHLLWHGPTFSPLQKLGRIVLLIGLVFMCCGFCFACPRPVFCVHSVAGFSGLFIPDCPFGFLQHLFAPLWYLYFPLQYFYANIGVSLKHSLLYSLILFKNLQFECIPHPVLTWMQKYMWTIHKYWSWGQYTIKPVLRGHIWDKEKSGLIRQVDILKEVQFIWNFLWQDN